VVGATSSEVFLVKLYGRMIKEVHCAIIVLVIAEADSLTYNQSNQSYFIASKNYKPNSITLAGSELAPNQLA